MSKTKILRRASLLPFLFAALPLMPAQAEEAADDGPKIEEIIITAQKRAQLSQDVGISIAAFSGDKIDKLGWKDSQDIAMQTPGLIATSFSGGDSTGLFSIRGISQNDFADHQEAPTVVYVDGVYLPSTSSTVSEFFDVSRVEVLRGPQGTLFGRNATGGLVHIINNAPTEEFEGSVKVTLAEYSQVRVEGAISGPITDGIRARVSFLTDKADGFFKNTSVGVDTTEQFTFGGFNATAERTDDDFRGRDHRNLRFQVDMDIAENAVLGFTVAYGEVNNIGNAYDTVPTPAGVVDLTTTDFFGTVFDPEPLAEGPNVSGFTDKESISYTADLAYSADTWNLTGIVNFANSKKTYLEDDDGGAFNIALFGTDQDVDSISAELRVDGEAENLNWTVGVYYLNIDGDYFGTFQFPGITGASGPGVFDGFGFGYDLNYALKTKSYAFFAQAEYALSEEIKLILGGRWTKDDKDFVIDADCIDDPAVPAGSCAAFGIVPGTLVTEIGETNLELNDDFFTWKAQLEFTPSDDLLLYAGWNRGVKAGNFTAPLDGLQPVSALTFRPEILDAYEAGFKADLLDNSLRINGGAYYYDYSDYQGFVFIGSTTIVNNFDAIIYGAELEVTAVPGDGWEISAGLSVMDATVKDVEITPGVFADQNMVLAPDFTANWLIRKDIPMGENTLVLQFDGAYTSEQSYNTINGPLVTGDGYVLMNARASYQFMAGGADAEFSVYVKNLANKANQTYAFDLSAFFGNTIQVFGPPRIFGASLGVHF